MEIPEGTAVGRAVWEGKTGPASLNKNLATTGSDMAMKVSREDLKT